MSQKSSDIATKLFIKNSHELSDKEYEVLLEQYKLYIELMDRISARRHQTNSFFLSVNVALITVLSSIISFLQDPVKYIWIIFATGSGILLCITWRHLIFSYRQLNSGKFKIIFALEKYFPARMFNAEWDVLEYGKGSIYIPFTKIERKIPLVFIGLYIAISFVILLNAIFIFFFNN